MAQTGDPKSLAVLIDADNTSARYAHAIFEELVKLGEANVRRYSSPRNRSIAAMCSAGPPMSTFMPSK